jgi:hypothetical protein
MSDTQKIKTLLQQFGPMCQVGSIYLAEAKKGVVVDSMSIEDRRRKNQNRASLETHALGTSDDPVKLLATVKGLEIPGGQWRGSADYRSAVLFLSNVSTCIRMNRLSWEAMYKFLITRGVSGEVGQQLTAHCIGLINEATPDCVRICAEAARYFVRRFAATCSVRRLESKWDQGTWLRFRVLYSTASKAWLRG